MIEILKVDIDQAGYIGRQGAITNIGFGLKKGELIGLIGPNGAGKSTTIKAILGLLPEMKGKVQFTGYNKNYAYIPEQPVLYDELTLWEHLELVTAVHGVKRDTLLEKGERLLGNFGLQKVKHQFPTTFSKGMQQKLMIILGLLIKPDVYIIDEPFVGLDPRATMKFIHFLKQEKEQGAGILLSTHQLDIAERICDTIILLSEGRLVAQGKLLEIQEKYQMPGLSLFDCFNFILENEL